MKFKDFIFKKILAVSLLSGRQLLLIILLIYFTPVLIETTFFFNFPDRWSSNILYYPFVPKILPPFADMRVVTAGAECIRLGYDVLIHNPCDPWLRPMNYPRVWSVFSFLNIDQSHTVLLSVFIILVFLFICFIIIDSISKLEALVYALIMCSPSFMLGVERGNIDLIIFIILGISLLIFKSKQTGIHYISYCLIFFSFILKLYPFFAFWVVLRENKKHAIIILSSALTLFFLYIFIHLTDIKLISEATPRGVRYSYGAKVIFDATFGRTSYNSAVSTLLMFIVIFASFSLSRKMQVINEYIDFNSFQIDCFRMGSAIYVATFGFGNNWDYRLIFLLLVIPQLLQWIQKNQNPLAKLSFCLIIIIVLILWISGISRGVRELIILDELLNWILLSLIVVVNTLTLPKWLKNNLKLN